MILPSRELMPVVRAALERGQRVRMTVTGSSMLPFIRDSDEVELEHMSSPPAPGDLVLAQVPEGLYVLHRVVKVEGEAFFLSGDAQNHLDGPFTLRDALGRVTMIYHNGRARGLGRGVWRFAGLVWVRCNPIGFWFIRLAVRMRRIGGGLVRRLQGIPGVRARLKRFHLAYAIEEADLTDLIAVNAWLGSGGDSEPPLTNPSTSNYVAKRGDYVIGLVRLGRHHEPGSSYSGYWLWSLAVRAPYRGMGVGEALARRVIRQAKAEEAQELFLAVFEDSLPAMNLYRKLGFERVVLPGLEEELIAEGQREGRRRVTMRKVLP
jgi:ribosomal protein S18 acetylase RimI-like enzyme